MGEIRRSPVEVSSLSHYLHGFIHPRWLFGISEPSTVTRAGGTILGLIPPIILGIGGAAADACDAPHYLPDSLCDSLRKWRTKMCKSLTWRHRCHHSPKINMFRMLLEFKKKLFEVEVWVKIHHISPNCCQWRDAKTHWQVGGYFIITCICR